MKQLIFLIIAVVLAIAATVLAFIFVVPEKRREKLNAFGKFLHDLCSFKFLVVEKILQALYIFSTAFIILYGVLQLFNVQRDYWTGASRWMGGTGLLCIIVGPIAVRLSYELMMMMAILLVKNVISINRKLADETGSAGGDVFAAPDVEELKKAIQRKEPQPQPPVQPQSPYQQPQPPYQPQPQPPVQSQPEPQPQPPVQPQPVWEEPARPAQFCRECGSRLENGVCPQCGKPAQEQ